MPVLGPVLVPVLGLGLVPASLAEVVKQSWWMLRQEPGRGPWCRLLG